MCCEGDGEGAGELGDQGIGYSQFQIGCPRNVKLEVNGYEE